MAIRACVCVGCVCRVGWGGDDWEERGWRGSWCTCTAWLSLCGPAVSVCVPLTGALVCPGCWHSTRQGGNPTAIDTFRDVVKDITAILTHNPAFCKPLELCALVASLAKLNIAFGRTGKWESPSHRYDDGEQLSLPRRRIAGQAEGAVVGRLQNGLCVGSCWLPPPSPSSPRLVNPIGRDTLLQLVRTVADLSLEKLPQFNAGQLVTLSWAMARMECTFLVPELFPAVCAAATPLLPAMTPQCLSELSWAVRKHLTSGSVSVERRNRDRETLAAIARASVKVAWEFKEVELSQLLWGLMDARAADAASVYGVLARACVSRMGAMQPRTLCTVAWSFASVAATEEPVDEGSGSDIGGSDTLVPRATLMVCVCTWSAL